MSSSNLTKCFVVEIGVKPKVMKGNFEPDKSIGTYGKFLKRKRGFAISQAIVGEGQYFGRLRPKPFFVVDPETKLAQPVGVTVVNDPKLAGKIEITTNEKYLKALVARVFDLAQTLLAMGAGAGVVFLTLHILSTLTGNPITI